MTTRQDESWRDDENAAERLPLVWLVEEFVMDEVAIKLHIEPLDEGGFLATGPDVPGLIAQGRTVREAVEIAQDVARKIADSCIEHGEPLPPALTKKSWTAPIDVIVPVGMG